MRFLTASISLILTFAINAQFSPIRTVNSNFYSFDIRTFEMNDSGRMLLITDPYNGGPTSNLMVYTSMDYGNTWDSTFMLNFAMMKDNSFVTEGGNMFFASIQNHFPVGSTPGYQRKVVHSSLDGGLNWTEKTIDSIDVGSNIERSLYFLNDSVGMYFYQKGEFVTNDYGQTWQKVYNLGAQCLGILDNRFILYTFQDIFTYNPSTSQIDSIEYLPYCQGNVYQTEFHNDISYRGIRAWDGQEQGYSASPSNYASLNIDQMPLGNQMAIHFPERFALVDLEVTETCIHLVLDGRYTRSCDGGNTFYDVDAFNGNLNEQVMFIDFVNDTLGFLVSKNLLTFEWRLWKTTNGGGANGDLVMTNHFTAGVEEVQNDFGFEVYPNPSQGIFTLQSTRKIDKVEVFNLLGEKIMSKNVKQAEVTLDMANYESGVYFVRAFSADGLAEQRIVLAK